jgi:ADP-ribose pyrophosphatase
MAERADPISSRTVFVGRVFSLVVDRVELPNRLIRDQEVIRHPGAAAIVPLHPNGEVSLVRQYRYALDDWLLEVPAGTLRPAERVADCAVRELGEEAGLRAEVLEPLGSIVTAPGFTDERIALFLARGLEEIPQSLDDDENLRIERLPFEEALRRAESGEIEDAKSVCALLRAAARLR